MKSSALKSINAFRSSEQWERLKNDNSHKTITRVLRSTRLETMIYKDLRERNKNGLDEIEAEGLEKLITFSSLLQDVFQALYSLNPRRNDEDALTTTARQFNAEIINFVMTNNQYPAIKALCEGRELPAYEAVREFAELILDKLDELLGTDSGGNAAEALNNIEQQRDELKMKLLEAMERGDPADEGNILSMAASIAGKEEQIECLSDIISQNIRKNKDVIQSALDSAAEKAQEVAAVLKSWGNNDSSLKALRQNEELLRRVQSSPRLREIAKYLGRYLEVLDNARKTGYNYGRGDKYDTVLGNDFTRAVSSEYAYLALPETVPLFIRKVQRKTLKQYRKRERISQGHGDIVVCIDESGSMEGDSIAWAKAVALVLLEYASQHKRSCAMVRFASAGYTETSVYEAGKYTAEDIFEFAESFLNGGTDFEAPLTEAAELIEREGFENADVVFITDGACAVSNEFATGFREKSMQLKFKVTGIVIDIDDSDMTFSLEPFCEKVYRLSELTGDDVAADVIRSKFR